MKNKKKVPVACLATVGLCLGMAMAVEVDAQADNSAEYIDLPSTNESAITVTLRGNRVYSGKNNIFEETLFGNETLNYAELVADIDRVNSAVAAEQEDAYQKQLEEESRLREQQDYLDEIKKMQDELLEKQAARAKAAEEEEKAKYLLRSTGQVSTTVDISDDATDGVTGAKDGPINISSGRNPYDIQPQEGTVYKVIS